MLVQPCYDHYPCDDGAGLPSESECGARAESLLLLIDDLIALHGPPVPPVPPARKFVKQGFYMCCQDCGMEVSYCNCDQRAAPDPPSVDAAESDLQRRIREARGR